MLVSDVKIGDKFTHDGKPYIRIDLQLSQMSLTTKYPDVVVALDIDTCKVICIKSDQEVELYQYPVKAQWIKPSPASQEFCSSCRKTPKMIFGMLPKFCPHCGELMDKEVRTLY